MSDIILTFLYSLSFPRIGIKPTVAIGAFTAHNTVKIWVGYINSIVEVRMIAVVLAVLLWYSRTYPVSVAMGAVVFHHSFSFG